MIDSITYAHCTVGFLAAVAVAGFDDVRSTIAVIGFLQHETVQVTVHLDAGTSRFGHISDALPPCHCPTQKNIISDTLFDLPQQGLIGWGDPAPGAAFCSAAASNLPVKGT